MGFDLYLELVYENSTYKVKFHWDRNDAWTTEISHPDINRYIKSWRQPNTVNGQYHLDVRDKNIGVDKIRYDGSNNMPFPQDSRRDCRIISPSWEERHCFSFDLSGVLNGFLSVRTNVTTPATFERDQTYTCEAMDYYTRNITVLPGACLQIYNGYTFTMNEYQNTTDAATMTVNGPPPSTLNSLILMPQSILNIKRNSTLIFKQNSNIYISSGSEIDLYGRSNFCNEGAYISGGGKIRFLGIVYTCVPTGPCYFQDSVKFIVEDTASFEIPDSTTYIFEGSETAFICKDQSTVKFGKGSKLIFNDGARIIANHTKFTTIDSNTTWDGIYINDVSYDTLKNCTIENALNGINVADNTSLYAVPAVEISNCTFSNKTGIQLLNQVYVNN